MILEFGMPQDGDWPEEYWSRIGEDPGFAKLEADFKALGVEVDDTEDVVLELPKARLPQVRALITAARTGAYGDDVRTYWTSAKER